MITKRDIIKAYAIFLGLGVAIIIVGSLTKSGICPIYNYTGIPCPSCGMTRSFKSLLNFNIGQAFWYHPLFPLVAFFPYIYVKKNQKLIIAVSLLFICVWILRLLWLFPTVSPMVPNQSAFLYKLFMYIK